MLENNRGKVCRKLVWRDFKFHKVRNSLLIFSIALVTALYSFTFSLGSTIEEGYLMNYELSGGFTSHIQYYNLTKQQAEQIEKNEEVKSTVRFQTVGQLTDEMLEYRNVQLAVADMGYAESVLSVPDNGRMPNAGGEVAMDVYTMGSLGIPQELGATVTIRWIPVNGEEEREDTYTLCGYWMSATNFTESYVWITAEQAGSLVPEYDAPELQNITLGVYLHQPKSLEEQGEMLLQDIGESEVSYSANPAYNQVYRDWAFYNVREYYLVNIFVALCGFFMIYSIIRILSEQEIRFFGQLKSLGMTPGQVRRVVYELVGMLCVIGIPIGWVLGFLLNVWTTSKIVVGMEENAAIYFFDLWPFLAAGVLSLGTTLFASILPARFVGRVTPAEAARYVKRSERSSIRTSRRTTIPGMAVDSLKRHKSRTVLSVVSMLLAAVLLCGTWILTISYDEEIYLEELALCDYHIVDGSVAIPYQRYNPKSHWITGEMAEEIKNRPGVAETGIIKTMEVNMQAGQILRESVIDYYNVIGTDGRIYEEWMAADPDWASGYENFVEKGEYIGIIIGLDGIALDAANKYTPYEGQFDAEAFASGDYAILVGADNTNEETGYLAGTTITIDGRDFTIMTSVPGDTLRLSGSNSREAEFSLYYYIPLSAFEELYPEAGTRQMMVNVEPEYREDFEYFLDGMEGDANKGIYVTRRGYYQENFRAGVMTETLVNYVVAFVLLVIGLLNFANTLVVKTLVRQKEFAVYESLGMTKGQIKKLLVTEGLMHMVLVLVILLPIVFIVTWFGMPIFIGTMNGWLITYQYSLLPLWIVALLLIAFSLVVPLVCFKIITGKSVPERLRIIV